MDWSLRDMLSEAFEVDVVGTLPAALRRMDQVPPDLLLWDLGSPEAGGLDGIVDLLNRIPSLPVVVVADGPDADGSLAPTALQLGAQDYLLKGQIDAPSLSRAIEHALHRARAARLGSRSASEIHLHHIAAGIPAAVYQYRLSPDGVRRFSFVSPGITQLTGLAAEKLEEDADRLWSLVVAEDSAGLDRSIRWSAGSLRPWAREFRIDPGDGHSKWIRATAMPVREADGGTIWNGIFVDVSEQRLLEDQLRQAQKMEAVGQLAGGVAHDFNNLLTAIGSSADMALSQLSDEHPIREHLGEILRAAERAADLTRQLLAFSRRQVLRLEVVDLGQVVLEGERLLRRLIGEAIRVQTLVDAAVPPVWADRGQLSQVLMNLVVNARDAMPDGGVLTLATEFRQISSEDAEEHRGMVPGPYSLMIVKDTGLGMDQATRTRIFEPFFTTKEAGKGTGLGLAMVYGIVKQIGGYVQVQSALGEGATFTIYLPADPSGVVESARSRPRRTHVRGTETVLVAEDEAGVRDPVRRILAAHGYRVLVAADGPEALTVASHREVQIDLLLTDVVMPGMSGADLAKAVRRVRPDIRVLYMSGYSTEAVRTHGILTPGASFLQKPFSMDELVQQVRDVLDRTGD